MILPNIVCSLSILDFHTGIFFHNSFVELATLLCAQSDLDVDVAVAAYLALSLVAAIRCYFSPPTQTVC